MARVRNQIYEASKWFKEALRIDNNNTNAISLLGNLHMSILEWGHAQKKFQDIIKVCILESYLFLSCNLRVPKK